MAALALPPSLPLLAAILEAPDLVDLAASLPALLLVARVDLVDLDPAGSEVLPLALVRLPLVLADLQVLHSWHNTQHNNRKSSSLNQKVGSANLFLKNKTKQNKKTKHFPETQHNKIFYSYALFIYSGSLFSLQKLNFFS